MIVSGRLYERSKSNGIIVYYLNKNMIQTSAQEPKMPPPQKAQEVTKQSVRKESPKSLPAPSDTKTIAPSPKQAMREETTSGCVIT